MLKMIEWTHIHEHNPFSFLLHPLSQNDNQNSMLSPISNSSYTNISTLYILLILQCKDMKNSPYSQNKKV